MQKAVYHHVRRLFLRGTISCSLNQLSVNCREDISGVGRFFKLELETYGKQLTQFRYFLSNRARNKKPASRFDFFFQNQVKNRNWVSWPSVGVASLQDLPILLGSSR